ncbi:MAG: hypothetical protein E6Q50_17155 [Lysobacter sp.]|nr:MAG: hypothetical protein E6Q50_17155 [Lysobacter sp.]
MRRFILAALSATAIAAVLAAPILQRAGIEKTQKRPVAAREDRGRLDRVPGRFAVVPVVRSLAAPAQPATGPIVGVGSPARIPPVSVRLSGALEDAGAGTPTVIVRVGDVQVPATIVGNAFVADLVYVRSASMVSIELSNTGVRHRALLGTAGQLRRLAGADNTLQPSEHPSLRVSPLSTALHFLISRELGGRLPADDDELDRALRSIFPEDIAPAANLLSKTALGAATLPGGFADGYALLQDQQAYRTFLRTNTATLGDANTYIRGVAGQPFSAMDLQRDWALMGRMLMNRVTFVQPSVQLMLKTPAGYALHANPSRRNVGFSPQIDANGDLVLTASGTVSYDTTPIKPFGLNGASVVAVERHTVNSERYRRLFAGKRTSLWLNLSDETLSYPEYPERGATAFAPVRYQFAAVLDDLKTSAQASHVLGRRGFPMFCLQPSLATGQPSGLGNCEFALHTFGASGSALMENVGQKVDSALKPVAVSGGGVLAWSLQSDGGLRVDGAGYSVRLWRLGISEGPADAMIYLATAQDGPATLTLSGHTIVIDGNTPVSFSATDPVGTWKYGTFGDERVAYAYNASVPFQQNAFVRLADGTQSQTTFVDPVDDATGETFSWTYRSGWKLINLDLYDTRYRANTPTPANISYFSSCEAAFAQGANQCAATRVRYFRPLAKVGNRWYGVEDLYSRYFITSYTPPFQFDRFSRANYYELQ